MEMNELTTKYKERKMRIKRLKEVIEQMNLLTDNDFTVEVDELNCNVKLGDDVYMIQYDKLDEYIDIKIQRYELIIDSAKHQGKYTLGILVDKINALTERAILLYRTGKEIQQ